MVHRLGRPSEWVVATAAAVGEYEESERGSSSYQACTIPELVHELACFNMERHS